MSHRLAIDRIGAMGAAFEAPLDGARDESLPRSDLEVPGDRDVQSVGAVSRAGQSQSQGQRLGLRRLRLPAWQ